MIWVGLEHRRPKPFLNRIPTIDDGAEATHDRIEEQVLQCQRRDIQVTVSVYPATGAAPVFLYIFDLAAVTATAAASAAAATAATAAPAAATAVADTATAVTDAAGDAVSSYLD